jgi:hypothetical protein
MVIASGQQLQHAAQAVNTLAELPGCSTAAQRKAATSTA